MSAETMDKQRLGFMPWLMWGLGALFYMYEFFLQVSPSVMVPDLMRDFNVSAAALGNLAAFYLYAYAFMQIPVGMLADRYGARRLLTFASLMCALGALIFGLSHVFTAAAIGRAFMGLGSSFAAICCLHIAASWLPLNRFALMTGVLLSMGMIGSFGAQGPLSMIIPVLGWRKTLICFGLLGVVLSVIIYSVVRDRDVAENVGDKAQRLEATGILAGIKHVISNKQIWIISAYGGLMFLAIPGFAGLWGITFLTQFYHIAQTKAAYIVSMIFIGFAIGAPFFGWLSDRVGRRKTPMYIGTIGSFASIATILYVPELPISALGPLFLVFGFFNSGFLPVFSVARESNPPETNATAMGFVNTLNSLGGAFAQLLIGVMLDFYWAGEMQNGVRLYDAHDYHFALSIIPIAIALSFVFLLFVKETYCHQQTQS